MQWLLKFTLPLFIKNYGNNNKLETTAKSFNDIIG